jgi:paraquat-inducible protein B
MSRKTNPTFIGIFVLGAILIGVGAVLFFGTTKLFTRTKTFVCFFQQSVAGIQVGSAVKFKGVPVGQVSKIELHFARDKPTYVKIIFDLNADLIVNSLGANVDLFNENFNRRQVARGLRASLAYESFITGQLYLELDYHADAPPPVYLQTQTHYSEIPSLPSNIEAIVEEAQKAIGNLGKIDFAGLSRDLEDVLTTTKKSIADIQFDELSASVRRTADSISGLASSPELTDALTSLKQALDHFSATMQTLQGQIDPVANALQPDLIELRKTLVGLQQTTGSLNSTLAPDGDLRYQLSGTLAEVDRMAKSLQQLADFLQRNPNSLLFGRKPAPGNKQ